MSDIVAGPWGGYGGFIWDDGKHPGIREIIIYHGGCIDSISLVYDDNGKPVQSPKHGGNGGKKSEIKLEYPNEILVGVRGHYHPFGSSGIVIRSLVLRSNLRTYGPYGTEEGSPFKLPIEGGHIVGMKGRCEKYINAIGFYLTSIPAKQKTTKEADGRIAWISGSMSCTINPRRDNIHIPMEEQVNRLLEISSNEKGRPLRTQNYTGKDAILTHYYVQRCNTVESSS